jgi:hypothetical protein
VAEPLPALHGADTESIAIAGAAYAPLGASRAVSCQSPRRAR